MLQSDRSELVVRIGLLESHELAKRIKIVAWMNYHAEEHGPFTMVNSKLSFNPDAIHIHSDHIHSEETLSLEAAKEAANILNSKTYCGHKASSFAQIAVGRVETMSLKRIDVVELKDWI